jgi:CheY-like chemotaxis protein
MSDSHEVLIIEDEPPMAETLAELCASLGCRTRIAPTLADVRAAIDEGGFCAVLLDLQIPSDAHARPLVGSGETALAQLRKHDKRRNAEGHHILPILVVTGYSIEPGFVTRLFKGGIDDFLPKSFDDGSGRPFRERLDGVLDKVRAALAQAGRTDHASCKLLGLTADPTAIHLAMGGETSGRRLVCAINGRRCELQAQHFLVLLRLALEHERDPEAWLTLHELGIARSPSVPGRIREAVAAALREEDDLIETRYGGYCRLKTSAVVALDRHALSSHAHENVSLLMRARAKPTKRGR